MIEREQEFRELVKTVHEAVDDYAEARLGDSGRDYFVEGLDNKAQNALHRLLAFRVVSVKEKAQ